MTSHPAPFDRQRLGVCYYPEHWPEERWATDAAMMREAGIAFARIGEFAWSRLEPEPGRLEFDWMARAIDTLHAHGVGVVLGTPTATPPKWLVDRMPDMVALDAQGRPRKFGSRRHYSFSHEPYARECERIVEALARRFGGHPGVVAWQTDNEYGCHSTVVGYDDAARDAFRLWLAAKYGSVAALNAAWGAVFWSMEYRSFDEVELPNLTVTEAAPSHRLDFLRFSSDQVARFDARQVEILRAHSPGRTILHNYMGNFHDFDHFKVGANLDVAGWDSYPLGHLDRDGEDEDTKARYRRIGDPDAQAFHHDLYRAVGRGRTWVMEQQPGAVNWAPYNPGPASGALRLWAYEAFAAGAEVVSYFRWRQAPFAQEQMHEGLLLPDASPNHGLRVVTEVSRELERLGATPGAPRADVALVFDYESVWAWRVQPQGADFSHAKIVMAFYRALRRRGIALDVVPPTSEAVAGRKLVLAPALFAWPPGFAGALAASPATVLIGPRSGSKTVDFQIPPNLPPGALGPALDLRVKTVESLPPGERVPVAGGGAFEGWREFVEAGAGADVLDVCQDGAPALVRRGRLHYLAGRPDADLLTRVVDALLAQAGVAGLDLPRDLRIRDRGDLRYVFNFGPDAIDARDVLTGFDMKMGGTEVPPKGVSIGAARTPRRAG